MLGIASFIKTDVLKNHFKTIIAERIQQEHGQDLAKITVFLISIQKNMSHQACKKSYSVEYGRS